MNDKTFFLKPFSSLPDKVLENLESKLLFKIYPKGSFVFKQGQPSLGYLFIIKYGLAEIKVTSENGMTTIVGVRHQGEFFGETVLLTGKRYPASLVAAEDLACFLLERQQFEELIQDYRVFAEYFSYILTDRLRNLYEEMVQENSCKILEKSTQPFKQSIGDIMSTPVVTCSPETSINNIARIFSEKKISSIVVVDKTDKMVGIVRERDLITKVLALDGNPEFVKAMDIMQKNPAILSPDAYFYLGLVTLIKRQDKFIVVVEHGRPIGMVTIGDLSRARITSSSVIVHAINNSYSIEEIAETTNLINKIVATMVSEKALANEVGEVVSELNDALTRRLLILAEKHLVDIGLGLPPVGYCWLTLGSGGRKEQSIGSDQDNAIVFENSPQSEEKLVKEYFLELAEFVVNGLERCGFVRCPGNVMATNPLWCMSFRDWRQTVFQWTNHPSPESLRLFTIFLDFRSVYGKDYLAQELRAYIFHLFRSTPSILNHMVIDDLASRVPLNLLRQVKVEKNKDHKNQVDLKKAACVHIIDCIRIFAMRDEIEETSTLGRLAQLVGNKSISSDDAEYFEAAIQSLMLFRIKENLRKHNLGLVPDNYINPDELSRRERSVLRESLIAINKLQDFTAFSFQVDNR